MTQTNNTKEYIVVQKILFLFGKRLNLMIKNIETIGLERIVIITLLEVLVLILNTTLPISPI